MRSSISGQSTGSFSKSIKRTDRYKDANAGLIRDLLIYGFICETFSKTEFPPEAIIPYKDSLTKFIKQSLHYYGYSSYNLEFDLSNLLSCIQIKKDTSDLECKDLKKFILPGENTLKGLLCKGLIVISENCVYIRPSILDIYKIDYPNFFSSIDDKEILSDAVISLLWILLASLHFCGKEVFKNQSDAIKFDLSPITLSGATFTLPINLRLDLRLNEDDLKLLKF